MRHSRRGGGGGGQLDMDGELTLDDRLDALMDEMGPATYREVALEADRRDLLKPEEKHEQYIYGLQEHCRHLGKRKSGGLAKRFSIDDGDDSISYPRRQMTLFQCNQVAAGLVRQRGRIDRTIMLFNRECMGRFGIELEVMQTAAGMAVKLAIEQNLYDGFTPDPDDDDEEE
jgi:hypothetical protein